MVDIKRSTNEEVLAAWDKGEPVWTIEMGGMGPGYEQCIQIMVFEMLRAMLADPFDWSEERDPKEWRDYVDKIDKTSAVMNAVDKLHPSGAQFNAAINLAAIFARNGYVEGMKMAPDDRHIMVSKNFPSI